jgi:uncharacterized protein
MTRSNGNAVTIVRMKLKLNLAFCSMVALACLTSVTPSGAANVDGLYDVVVLPTQKAGDSSFAEAMRQVAVRVSGSRDAATRVMVGKPDALRFTQKINLHPAGYPDGSVQVEFGSTLFDKMLTTAGLPIWGRERPGIAVWLALPDATGRIGWVSANDTSTDRETVRRVALARGIPLIWPAMDSTDLITAAAFTSGSRSYSQLMASGERYRADAVLLGVGSRDSAGNTVVRWSFAFNDEVTDFTGSLDEGLHHAADRCARVFAIAPGARAVVALQVIGIRDFDAYARALKYLEGITLVTAGGVSVDQVGGEELGVRLTVRGDATSLRRTIGLSKGLVEVKSDDPALRDRLVFRLVP